MAITAVRALASEMNFILFPVKNVVVLYVLVLEERINVIFKSRMSCIEGRLKRHELTLYLYFSIIMTLQPATDYLLPRTVLLVFFRCDSQ